MIAPDQFKKICGQLLTLVTRQSAITAKVGLNNPAITEGLNDASVQLSDDALRVLVMGKFSSGKSTFLNALMGKTFLPTRPTPATAVIGEISYAENPEAILYPKQGYPAGTKPFSVKVEDLDKYILIDNTLASKDEQKKTNPFRKVDIHYPLDICRNGVILVDSPGLDDPTCHDEVTKTYLPQADTIIYCMNSSQAFSAADMREIENLRALGYTSMIFVLTYFDVLQSNDLIMGTHGADEARAHYTKILKDYTDLGSDGVVFVGSLPALKAKLTSDQRLLEESNFPVLEKKLETILFNEKGRMKLLKALYSTRRANRKTKECIDDKIELANSNKDDLKVRMQAAREQLAKAQEKSKEIFTQFQIGSSTLVNGAKDRGRSFFLTEILPNINQWVKEFEPGDDQGISIMHPKRTSAAFAEACISYVQRCIETRMAKWCEESLVEGYIGPRLRTLTEQQNANLESFENDLKQVRTTLNLSINTEEVSEEENASAGNRILSAIAGAFLNPASLLIGSMMGWRGLVTSLVTTLVGGIVLGIVSLFTPVGIPALIITWIVSAITGGIWGLKGLEGRVREAISKKLHEQLTQSQEDMVANIGNSVGEVIQKIQQSVKDELDTPVRQYNELLNETERITSSESTELTQQMETYRNLKRENSSLEEDMEDFAQGMNM